MAAQLVWPDAEPTATATAAYLGGAQPAAAPAGIFTIRVTISAADFADITRSFDLSGGDPGGGSIGDIPAGSNRTVEVQALDGTGTALYQGSALGIAIVPGQTTAVSVALTLIATTPPAAPMITSPTASPHYSSGTTLTLQGACTDGNTVSLAGAETGGPTACASAAYSFGLDRTAAGEGSYAYAVTQSDGTLTSAEAALLWVVDQTAPGPVSVPPHATTATDSFTISGTCEEGATVALSGADNQTTTCTGGGFAFTVNETTDNTYGYTVTQTDPAGNASTGTPYQWTRDTGGGVTAAPVVTTPATSPHYASALAAISGTCDGAGPDVDLAGDAGTDLQPCTSGNFTLTVTDPGADGTYHLVVTQGTSGHALLTWVRDTAAPANPTVTQPSGAVANSSSTLTIAGGCETGATVALAGDDTQSTTCVSAAYAFTVTELADGAYSYTVSQTDRAGNTSPGPDPQVDWTREAVPPTPVITSPATATTVSNALSAIDGTCTAGYTVDLAGADAQSMTCTGGDAFTFAPLDPGSDGTYVYTVTQTSPAGLESLATDLTWVRDTDPPGPVVVTAPSPLTLTTATNSIDITGTCETDATVSLTGDATAGKTCVAGAFSFTISKFADATYNITVTQTDRAGNGSTGPDPQVAWTRSTTPPAPPVITPLTDPHTSNSSPLVLDGTCAGSGFTVTLAGADSQTTPCTAGNAFSFTIAEGADGTYTYRVSQTEDATGLSSFEDSLTWTLDSVAPPLTIQTPSGSPVTSAPGTLTIAGTCETGTDVEIGGAEITTVPCTSGSYTFTATQAGDGSFTYTVDQTDLAGNAAAQQSVQWDVNSAVPPVPTIDGPNGGVSPFYSNGSSIVLTGDCESTADPHTVNLGGADSQGTACASSRYSFTVNKGTDATYVLTVSQTNDNTAETSGDASFTWVRDTAAPAAPVISSPGTDPVVAEGNDLIISGTCETDATVNLSGASTQNTPCIGGAYSFTVTKYVDATYDFTLTQTDRAGNESAAETQQWQRVTPVPDPPTITSPAGTTFYSNTPLAAISGGCTSSTPHTVTLGGAQSGSTDCSGSAYSIPLTALATDGSDDGTYILFVTQTDGTATSAQTGVTWIFDTVAPAVPVLSTPTVTPIVTTGDDTVLISGTCEAGSTVTVAGDNPDQGTWGGSSTTADCTDGTFAVTATQTANGTYNYDITVMDLAGNTSDPLAQSWVRNDLLPATPVIQSPAINPTYTTDHVTGLTVQVTCDDTIPHVVVVDGDLTPGTLVPCDASPVSIPFANPGADGTQTHTFAQVAVDDLIAQNIIGQLSGEALLTWIVDTGIPAAPTILVPSVSPYTAPGPLSISGICEVGATVAVTDVFSATTTPTACVDGTFAFSGLTQAVDGDYVYDLIQTDPAGNASPTASFTWERRSDVLPPPVITLPTLNPITSNTEQLTVLGTCVAGFLVDLEEVGVGIVQTQTCVSGSFGFTIDKTGPAGDGTHDFNITQNNGGTPSAPASIRWVKDTSVPDVVLDYAPLPAATAPNPTLDSIFEFSSTDPLATFQCNLDDQGYRACATPKIYEGLIGTHSVLIRAIDDAGNISAPTLHSWTQQANATVVLYHLDDAAPFADSSIYPTDTPPIDSALTINTASVASASGQFAQGREFGDTVDDYLGETDYVATADNDAHRAFRSVMTVEAFVSFRDLKDNDVNPNDGVPNKGAVAIVSKFNDLTGQREWEFGLQRNGGSSKFRLYFLGWVDVPEALARSGFVIDESDAGFTDPTPFHHVAVVWSRGTVLFFFDGLLLNSATLGTAGSALLPDSTAELVLGASDGGAADFLDGVLDEVRISQIIRYTGDYTVPAGAFTAD